MALTEVMSPKGELPPASSKLVPPLGSLEGMTVGLDDSVSWLNFKPFLDKVQEIIQERYHPKAIVSTKRTQGMAGRRAETDALLEQWVEQVDCAVLGLAA